MVSETPPDTVVGRRLAALQAKEAERKALAEERANPKLSDDDVALLQARAKSWRRQPDRRQRFISKTADFAMLKLEREMRRCTGKEFRDNLKQFMALALLAQGAPADAKEDE